MKQVKYYGMMVAMLLCAFTFSACGSDDDDSPVDTQSYITGTWRSFKATGYYQGETVDIAITKDGAYYALYTEFVFDGKGVVTGYVWEQDKSGASHWVSETGKYTVSGNVVNVTFGSETTSLTFDEKAKTLAFRGYSDGITVFIYLHK